MLLLPEAVAGSYGLFHVIDQAEVHDLDAWPLEPAPYAVDISRDALLEASELRPICVVPYAIEADFEDACHASIICLARRGYNLTANRCTQGSRNEENHDRKKGAGVRFRICRSERPTTHHVSSPVGGRNCSGQWPV
jgi:hypothetical protein